MKSRENSELDSLGHSAHSVTRLPRSLPEDYEKTFLKAEVDAEMAAHMEQFGLDGEIPLGHASKTQMDVAILLTTDKVERLKIHELGKIYERWHQDFLKKAYQAACYKESRTGSEEGYRWYCKQAIEERRIPGPDFFYQEILPVVRGLARTPEELEKITMDAIDSLKGLVQIELWSGNRRRPSCGLIDYFFENVEADSEHYHSRWKGTSNARGQFRYFTKKYRSKMAAIVAWYQGRKCDPYFDPGIDEIASTKRVEELFDQALEKIPEQHRERGLGILLKFMKKTTDPTIEFWNRLGDIMTVLTTGLEPGKDDQRLAELSKNPQLILYNRPPQKIVDYFLTLAEAHKRPGDKGDLSGCYIMDKHEVLAELVQLYNCHEFEQELLSFAIHCIREGTRTEWSSGLDIKMMGAIRFSQFDAQESIDFCPIGVVRKWQVAGVNKEEIKARLTLHEKFPFIGASASEILLHYEKIEENFPEGVAGLIKYVDEIQTAKECCEEIVEAAYKATFAPEKWSTYLESGKMLVEMFGDNCRRYFQIYGVFPIIAPRAAFSPESAEPEVFRAAMRECRDLTLRLCKRPLITSNSEKGIFETVLTLGQDPGFPEYVKGLEELIEAVSKYFKEIDERYPARKDEGYSWMNPSQEGMSSALRHYQDLPYSFVRNGALELPEDVNFSDQAKIIASFVDSGGDMYGYSQYQERVSLGLDYRISAAIRMGGSGGRELYSKVHIVPAVELPVSQEQALRIARGYALAEEALYEAQCCSQDLQRHWRERLTKARKVIVTLAQDPELIEYCGVFFGVYKDKIDTELSKHIFLDMLSGPAVVERLNIPATPLLTDSNPATQALICGIAMLGAVGAIDIPGITDGIRPLKITHRRSLLRKNGITGLEDSKTGALETLAKTSLAPTKELMRRVKILIPRIEAAILQARLEMPGLMPVGAKIHSKTELDDHLFRQILAMFGLSNTSFHLLEQNKTLVLPPLPSAFEIKLMIRLMQELGMIDPKEPQLQFTIAGQWDEEHGATVGSSILLGSRLTLPYAPRAFETSHRETGRRIMAFDAGVRHTGLPFDHEFAEGRTDILARYHPDDVDLHQVIGTGASHHQFDGMLGTEFRQYDALHGRILRHFGLEETARSSAWICSHAQPGDTPESHLHMVNRFADCWGEARQSNGYGVIGVVRKNILNLMEGVMARREEIIAARPQDYERLKTY